MHCRIRFFPCMSWALSDTHPDDTKAMQALEQYRRRREERVQEYERCFVRISSPRTTLPAAAGLGWMIRGPGIM